VLLHRPLRPNRALLPLLAAALLAPAASSPPAGAQPAAPERAAAEAPASARPFPAIEAGMHTAIIRRIAVDRAGRWAVTASEDKTARLWNLATGQLERVLRVPLGEGAEGKLYAVALSPDGALVALGGYTSPDGLNESIYLFDRASGRLLQRLSGLPNVVNHLAFAADGRRLAAALFGGNGIRVYGTTGQGAWAQVAADGEYGADSYSVEFDAAGRLLATSWDGELRLYGAGASGPLQPLVRRAAPGGKRPFFARFSPDGRRIAVGFDDSTAVALLDGTSLQPLAAADTSSITNGNFYGLAWSADGRRLLAAGRYTAEDGSRPLVVWPAGGGAPQRLPLGLTNSVMDLRPLADGRLVYAGGDPAWGVLDPQLRRTAVFAGPPVLDHRNNPGGSIGPGGIDAFRLAADGRWLEFRAVGHSAQGPNARLVRFDLAERRLLLPGATTPGGLAPRSTGLPIEGWYNTTSPTLAGKTLPLEKYDNDLSRSLAISANGSSFALGTERAVRLFEADGRPRWRTYTPGPAWLVILSADGRYVVAALSDGTIRWYRSSDGKPALSLFVHPDLQRWILWTPEGFYDASPGGAELLGYHLNNGRNEAGTFIRASQLSQRFFRPDLIARRLAGEEAAITAAVAEVGDVRTSLSVAKLPPQIRLIGRPQPLPSGEVEITYELIDRGDGIGAVETRLGQAVIEGRANPPVAGINRRRLALPSGKVRAQLVAFSRSGVASDPVIFELEGGASSTPPTLHLLAVGITAYRDEGLRRGVRFAAADAQELEATLRRPGLLAGANLGTVKRIPDGEASRERITAELQAMAKVVKPGDRFVLYLAGHGTGINGEYYFLTQELSSGSDADVRRQALSGTALRDLLKQIPASATLLLFDTCSSGTYGSTAQQDLKASVRIFEQKDGRLMLAAAGDRRMALESPFNQRGIFTAVVIDGLLGKADFSKDRVVKATELLNYVLETVPEITERQFQVRQEPHGSSQGNFPLTRSGAGAP
jgi:WD40 repeat protein